MNFEHNQNNVGDEGPGFINTTFLYSKNVLLIDIHIAKWKQYNNLMFNKSA